MVKLSVCPAGSAPMVSAKRQDATTARCALATVGLHWGYSQADITRADNPANEICPVAGFPIARCLPAFAALRDRRRGYVRPRPELERLFAAAHPMDVALDERFDRPRAIANALNKGDLCRASISAVLLKIPDFPDYPKREGVEDEDRLLKFERRARKRLAKFDFSKFIAPQFDESKHPRWPKGQTDGGEFRPKDGADNQNSSIRPVSDIDDPARHGIGGNKGPPLDDPPQIPAEPPV
jgi:hypothetical protein